MDGRVEGLESLDAAELFGPNADATPSPDDFLRILYEAMQREAQSNPHGEETVARYIDVMERRAARRAAA